MDIFKHSAEDTILDKKKNMTTAHGQETTITTGTMGTDSHPTLQCTSWDPTPWDTMATLYTLSTDLGK